VGEGGLERENIGRNPTSSRHGRPPRSRATNLEIFLGMNRVGQEAAREAEEVTHQESAMAEARALAATQVEHCFQSTT
jgi:hypothetical protein